MFITFDNGLTLAVKAWIWMIKRHQDYTYSDLTNNDFTYNKFTGCITYIDNTYN